MKFLCLLYALIGVIFLAQSLENIEDHGAIAKTDTLAAQTINAKAIVKAILAANSSSIDRAVKIPKKTFYTMPIIVADLFNVSIIIEDKLSASKNVSAWPTYPSSLKKIDMILI